MERRHKILAWAAMGAMTLMAGSLTAAERTGTSQPRMLQEAGAFRLAADDGQAAVRKLGMEVRDGVAAVPFPESKAVTGVAVSGKIIRHDPDYIVRILLRDRRGREHLILESYEDICDGDTVLFSDYCEETALMDGIDADSVKVVARGATVQLDRLRYGRAAVSEAALRKAAARTAAVLRDTLRRQQVQRIADRINEYNEKNNRLWRAGVTGVALQPYEVRKHTVGFSDEVSSLGLEYYAGGIFQFGSHRKDAREDGHAALKSVTATATAGTSPFPESFDWRNRHGRNWLTPFKSQGLDNNLCTAFAAVGCLEALVNLYLNRKLDLDLSEQSIIGCADRKNHIITNDPYTNGFYNEYTAVDFIKNHGICAEYIYPFAGVPGKFCEWDSIIPDYVIDIENYGIMSRIDGNLNFDSIRQALIHYGPLYSGYNNGGSGGHTMVLYGYKNIVPGDSFTVTYNYGSFSQKEDITITEIDAGNICWCFKNSWEDWPQNFYAIFDNIDGCIGTLMMTPAILHISANKLIQELNTTIVYEDTGMVTDTISGDSGQNPPIAPVTYLTNLTEMTATLFTAQ